MDVLNRIKYKSLYLLSQTSLRGLLEKYRHKGLRENDVFLVSYQNSGSTWLRNLLYESIIGKPPGKKSKDKFPFVGNHKKSKSILKNNGRLIKSHSPYRKEYYRKKVIYLVRDPRDIVVSKYKKRIKQKYHVKSVNREINLFIGGKMVSEGKWNTHVKSWLEAKKQGKIELYVIKYENLKKNPKKELAGILKFLNMSRSKKQIQKAIKDNSIKKMKKTNPHARKGNAGGWKEELTEKQVKKIEDSFEETMKRVDYLK